MERFSINHNYLLDITKLIKKLAMADSFLREISFQEKEIDFNFLGRVTTSGFSSLVENKSPEIE